MFGKKTLYHKLSKLNNEMIIGRCRDGLKLSRYQEIDISTKKWGWCVLCLYLGGFLHDVVLSIQTAINFLYYYYCRYVRYTDMSIALGGTQTLLLFWIPSCRHCSAWLENHNLRPTEIKTRQSKCVRDNQSSSESRRSRITQQQHQHKEDYIVIDSFTKPNCSL